MEERDRRQGTRAMTIRFAGVLDLAAALRLAAALGEAPDGVRLRVDVRSAREVHDVAIVALARAVARRNGALVGLSRHHAMLLGYVGGHDAGTEAPP